MLVITRKAAESFIIGDNIRISILGVNGDKIKIGIEAPKDVAIMRSEVYDTIHNNIEAVAAQKLPDLELLKRRIFKE
jgi:carbon storage regulator